MDLCSCAKLSRAHKIQLSTDCRLWQPLLEQEEEGGKALYAIGIKKNKKNYLVKQNN